CRPDGSAPGHGDVAAGTGQSAIAGPAGAAGGKEGEPWIVITPDCFWFFLENGTNWRRTKRKRWLVISRIVLSVPASPRPSGMRMKRLAAPCTMWKCRPVWKGGFWRGSNTPAGFATGAGG